MMHDGFVDAVDFDDNDRLCLDGQRLIEVTKTVDDSACSGFDGSTATALAEYSTEIRDYTRIVACGSGSQANYFKAFTKGGNILTYGRTSSAKLYSHNRYGTQENTQADQVLIWGLDRIDTAVGTNYMDVFYDNYEIDPHQQPSNGVNTPFWQFRPQAIHYGLAYGVTASVVRKVTFKYQDLSSYRYAAGTALSDSRLLTIETSIETTAEKNIVREYRFSYGVSSGASGRALLRSIYDCSHNASGQRECLQPLTFEWQESKPVFDVTSQSANINADMRYVQITDINRDGRADVFYPQNGFWQYALAKSDSAGFSAANNTGITLDTWFERYIWPLDYNADGIGDFLVPNPSSNMWHVLQGSASGTFSEVTTTIPSTGYRDSPSVADVDGDGIADLIYIQEGNIYVRPITASGFGAASLAIDGTGNNLTGIDSRLVLVDFNQDGRVDIMVDNETIEVDQCRIYLSNSIPGNYKFIQSDANIQLNDCWNVIPFDVNADGYMDLLSSADQFVFSDGGAGWANPPGAVTVPLSTSHAGWRTLDYNADGRMDLILHGDDSYLPGSSANWIILQSTGSGFTPVNTNIPYRVSNDARSNYRILDINGDGLTDILVDEFGSWRVYVRTSVNETYPDLLTKITDGFGATVDVQYQPTTNSAVYQPGSTVAPTYPVMMLSAPLYVVSAYQTDVSSMSYQYENARIDRQGRGFLGFETVTAKNLDTSVYKQVSRDQVFPDTGQIKSIETYTLNGVNKVYRQKTAITTQSHDRLDGTFDIYIQERIATTYELDGNAIKTSTTTYRPYTNAGNNTASSAGYEALPIDKYGNLKEIEVIADIPASVIPAGNYNDGFTQITVNALYDPVLSGQQYFVSQLKRSTTTVIDPNNDSRSIAQDYTYYSGSGLVHCQTVHPDDNLLRYSLCYEYDSTFNYINKETQTGFDGSFDNNGNPVSVSVTSTRVRTTSVTGLQTMNATRVSTEDATGAALTTTTTIHAAYGNVTQVSNFNQQLTTMGYDAFGREDIIDYPDSAQKTWDYTLSCSGCPSDTAFVVTETNSGAPTTEQAFDKLGRLRQSRELGAAGTLGFTDGALCQTFQYYSSGVSRSLLSHESQPYFCNDYTADNVFISGLYTKYEYDAAHRIQVVTKSDGSTETHSYLGATANGIALLSSVQRRYAGALDATLSTTQYRNTQGWIIEAVDPAGNSNSYQYDPFGNPTQVIVAGDTANPLNAQHNNVGQRTQVDDPNMGFWQYRYNAFGELKWQKDAKGTQTTFAYDGLARLMDRQYAEPGQAQLSESWGYDSGANAKGRLTSTSGGGVTEGRSYNALGLLETVSRNLAGTTYDITYGYDNLSRLTTTDYPSVTANGSTQRLRVRREYSNNRLAKICTVSGSAACDTNNTHWRANTLNEYGQLTNETRGKVTTARNYDAATGFLDTLSSTSGYGSIQNLDYDFDSLGNLRQRIDANRRFLSQGGVTDIFSYDQLNRLKTATVNGNEYLSVVYGASGNIEQKTGIGQYTYGGNGAGPNAVTATGDNLINYPSNPPATAVPGDANGDGVISAGDVRSVADQIIGLKTAAGTPDCNQDAGVVDILDTVCIKKKSDYQGGDAGEAYQYDANGNRIEGDGTYITYTPYNKPSELSNGEIQVRFDYDANHNRYRKTEIDNSGTTTTDYIGKTFEVIQPPSGVTEYRQYIAAAGETVAVITERTNNTNNTRYLYGDHQGTVVAITDANGQLVSRYHYDPFGQRQEVTWTDNTVSSLIDDIVNRGYTQHENLAVLGLIHMNGRVYDPKLGRFLSADPFVQFPISTQGYNRYSYVGNNPLSFTDPSGYFTAGGSGNSGYGSSGSGSSGDPTSTINRIIVDNPRVTGAGLALVGVGLVVIEAVAGGACAGVCANLGYSMIGTGVAIILGGSSDPNAAADAGRRKLKMLLGKRKRMREMMLVVLMDAWGLQYMLLGRQAANWQKFMPIVVMLTL